MKIKCFKVDTIEYKDKDGNKRVFYRVWFNFDAGLGWLSTDKPVSAGQEVELGIRPVTTQDTKTNMRLSLFIV